MATENKKASDLVSGDFIEIPGNYFAVPKRGVLSCTVKNVEKLPTGHYKIYTISAGATKSLHPKVVFKLAETHLTKDSFRLPHSRAKTFNGLGID